MREQLADLARGTLRHKLPQLQQALHGQIEPHHQVLLGQIFAHMSYLEHSIQHLQLEIEQRLCPFEEAKQLLLSIPGIQEIAAAAILAEIGVDMSRFPSPKHLASWAGVCPGNKQSGGKRLSGKTTKGNARLRSVLIEVVWNISRMKNNYLSARVTSLGPAIRQTQSGHRGRPQPARHHLSRLVRQAALP
jgi:transposase